MPDFQGQDQPVLQNPSVGTLVPGVFYRTNPCGFAEASKRAAHYRRLTVATVVTVTPWILDTFREIFIPSEIVAMLWKKQAPRARMAAALRRVAEDVPGCHPWRN
jgi:hypothetical protein